MNRNHVQCPCGQALILPKLAGGASAPDGIKIRCPACKAILLVKGSTSEPSSSTDPVQSPPPPPSAPRRSVQRVDDEDDEPGGEYAVADSPVAKPSWTAAASNRPATWVAHAPPDDAPPPREDPIPNRFFDATTLIYPWRLPTFWRWIGLSFMSLGAGAMLAGAMFLLFICGRFGLIGSVFTMAMVVMGCFAVCAFVNAVFISVIEQTANGDDTFERFPSMAWMDTLPPFFRTFGAAIVTCCVMWLISLPVRPFAIWHDPRVLPGLLLVGFIVFPVLLISNLVEGSWMPLFAIWPTLVRLTRCAGWFAVFLSLAVSLTVAIAVAMGTLAYLWNPWGWIIGGGPLAATWMMYYGHWLGRLGRKMIHAD